METHCCFNTGDKCFKSPRIHVPLAEKCSLGCVYCGYKKDHNITKSKTRPGVAINAINKKEDIRDYLKQAISEYPETKIVGVSGPGDPLENIESLCFLADIIKEENYNVCLCICTNGRCFFENGIKIIKTGLVDYMTFTVNTLDPSKIPQIYNQFNNKSAIECSEFIHSQLNAIKYCKDNGIKVKVNTVLLDDISINDIRNLYNKLLDLGVDCFNLLPKVDTSIDNKIEDTRRNNLYNELKSQGFKMTRQCNLCRSDFCGY